MPWQRRHEIGKGGRHDKMPSFAPHRAARRHHGRGFPRAASPRSIRRRWCLRADVGRIIWRMEPKQEKQSSLASPSGPRSMKRRARVFAPHPVRPSAAGHRPHPTRQDRRSASVGQRDCALPSWWTPSHHLQRGKRNHVIEEDQCEGVGLTFATPTVVVPHCCVEGQCDMKTGTAISQSISRVTPPRISSSVREWP